MTPEVRRARIIGIVELGLAIFVLFVFALASGSDADATLRLALPRETPIDWIINARTTGFVVAAILVALAATQLTRGFGSRANAVLGGAMVLFIVAFLAWAAAGQSFSLIGMLTSTVVLSVPVTLGGLTGVMSERVAIINILSLIHI